MNTTAHTYQVLNNNDDCPVCKQHMQDGQLGWVMIGTQRVLTHWACRVARLNGEK